MTASITYNGAARTINLFGTKFTRGKTKEVKDARVIERAKVTQGFNVRLHKAPAKEAPKPPAEPKEKAAKKAGNLTAARKARRSKARDAE